MGEGGKKCVWNPLYEDFVIDGMPACQHNALKNFQLMKLRLTLILAGLALSGFTGTAATLDLSSLGGSFPTYTANGGIPGLQITYTVGDSVGTTENRGYSGDTGGMSLPPQNFPDGHLAVGPGDRVVLDFTNVNGQGSGGVFIGFIDLDNNAFAGDEGATVTSQAGITNVPGAPGQILNSEAHLASNIFNVGPLTPDANNQIVIQASTSAEQQNAGNGFFAITVGTDVIIPEPSSAMLGLLGLTFLVGRRRRTAL